MGRLVRRPRATYAKSAVSHGAFDDASIRRAQRTMRIESALQRPFTVTFAMVECGVRGARLVSHLAHAMVAR